MASLVLLELRLAKAVANGDEVKAKKLRKQIDAERQRRGKNKRQGL